MIKAKSVNEIMKLPQTLSYDFERDAVRRALDGFSWVQIAVHEKTNIDQFLIDLNSNGYKILGVEVDGSNCDNYIIYWGDQ